MRGWEGGLGKGGKDAPLKTMWVLRRRKRYGEAKKKKSMGYGRWDPEIDERKSYREKKMGKKARRERGKGQRKEWDREAPNQVIQKGALREPGSRKKKSGGDEELSVVKGYLKPSIVTSCPKWNGTF